MPKPLTPTHGIVPALDELIALRGHVLAWPPPTRSAERQAGAAPAPLRGRGMDYAESRPYVAGDDARHIDWRVTARTGRMHTKVFHAERDRVTLLLADTAPTLYFGTRRCFKSVQAARAGALAAWAAQRSGDRIAALRGSTVEAPRPPQGGVRGALRALDALARWYGAPQPDDAGLERALEATVRVVKPGARVVALLDPRSVDGCTDARLTALAAHHDAIAVLLVDPFELDPPVDHLAFATTDGEVELDLDEDVVRRQWDLAFAARYGRARERLLQLGWRTLVLRTDEAPDIVLGSLLPRRREAA
ncbi:MAG TPA: DUF58 domain-containing protein [Xanthomonadales bacterium]|nr:DUF58 domain-containing protein [Xanthomonadales bacterium]